MSPLLSESIALEKSTALLELLDFNTVVLAKVFEPEVDTVPNPTSNSLAFWWAIA